MTSEDLILQYINFRIEQLEKNKKDLPKTTQPKRREVAIRQTQGRILELKSLKIKLKYYVLRGNDDE